jgi:uncharacterized protein (DUF1015 family)
LATEVAAPPYDVLSSDEARTAVDGNPHSFLHVTKSEVDMPVELSIYDSSVYEKAKSNLEEMLTSGMLFQDERPCYYIYELVMDGRSQTGLVCCSSVDDYENDIIKKHEFTRPEKEKDRINHIKITRAQTGNVFLAYRNVASLDQLIGDWKKNNVPAYDFKADDGISHRIWVIAAEDAVNAITSIFEKEVPCTYIADGHHRAASAAKVRAALGANATKNADYFLTTLFPSNQLYIMDYNRVVKDLNGLTAEAFIEVVSTKFDIEQLAKEPFTPATLHEFGMYINGCWYKLTAKPGTYTNDPIGILDVTILQNNILNAILGIADPRTDARIDFVGGIRGLQVLADRVDNGQFAAAFSLYAVTIDQLFAIADSGNVMPPKSTWFEPKLRDGLLTHLIYE